MAAAGSQISFQLLVCVRLEGGVASPDIGECHPFNLVNSQLRVCFFFFFLKQVFISRSFLLVLVVTIMCCLADVALANGVKVQVFDIWVSLLTCTSTKGRSGHRGSGSFASAT